MTTHDEPTLRSGPVTTPASEPAPVMWAPGPGHAYPATAPGVPLSGFSFAFAVGFLGLVETGILSSAANDIFIATCFGIGAVGLLIGGLWEFRSGELFGGTFGVGYAGFLFSTALILKFFAPAIITAGGRLVRSPRRSRRGMPGQCHPAQRDHRPGTAADVAGPVPPGGIIASRGPRRRRPIHERPLATDGSRPDGSPGGCRVTCAVVLGGLRRDGRLSGRWR
jgi:hypothetical protein